MSSPPTTKPKDHLDLAISEHVGHMNMQTSNVPRLSAKKFRALIQQDPSWCRKLRQPIEISGYCDMEGTTITHLSPYIIFTGGKNDV